MAAESTAPIACALTGGSYQNRIEANRALARRGLVAAERHGLTLRLTFRREVAADVRAMIAAEQKCCAFLTFNLEEQDAVVHVDIQAPQRAARDADALFAQFVPDENEPPRPRAGKTANTIAAGAIACAACCAIPLAWPVAAAVGAAVGIAWLTTRLRGQTRGQTRCLTPW